MHRRRVGDRRQKAAKGVGGRRELEHHAKVRRAALECRAVEVAGAVENQASGGKDAVAAAETYSMVGRSLPLTLLSVWEKYRLRWGADAGREGFRMRILPCQQL